MTLLTYAGKGAFVAEGRTSPSHIFHKSSDNQYFISNGLGSLKKVNGLNILLAGISMLAGVIALLYLFISGIWQVFRFKLQVWKRPLVWCFFAIFLILLSSLFLIHQPFITSGDLTTGSFLLALGTALLPLFTMVSIYKYWGTDLRGLIPKVDFVSLLLLLQLLVVLIFNGLIPFVLWK